VPGQRSPDSRHCRVEAAIVDDRLAGCKNCGSFWESQRLVANELSNHGNLQLNPVQLGVHTQTALPETDPLSRTLVAVIGDFRIFCLASKLLRILEDDCNRARKSNCVTVENRGSTLEVQISDLYLEWIKRVQFAQMFEMRRVKWWAGRPRICDLYRVKVVPVNRLRTSALTTKELCVEKLHRSCTSSAPRTSFCASFAPVKHFQ